MSHTAKLIGFIWILSLLESGCGGAHTPPPPGVAIVTASLPDGFVAFPYSQTIQATGGVPPFTWTVSSGALPHSVTLGDDSTSFTKISGTPDMAQSAVVFTIQVTDAKNQGAVESYTINIENTDIAQLQEVEGQVPADTVEIQGLSAGSFNPTYWQINTLNWVADVRQPTFAAQTTGQYQNIYAPWPLEQPNGWRMFFGGWDGSDLPFDQVS